MVVRPLSPAPDVSPAPYVIREITVPLLSYEEARNLPSHNPAIIETTPQQPPAEPEDWSLDFYTDEEMAAELKRIRNMTTPTSTAAPEG